MLIIGYRFCRTLIEGKRRFSIWGIFLVLLEMDHLTSQCVWSRPEFFFLFFVFLQSRVDRLSSEWWNKWWDGSQTHRAASVGNRRVKVFGSFSCRVLSMTRPSWTCTIIDRVFCIRCQVLIDLSYSPPWLEVFELLLRVVRLPSENTCSGLIFMIEVDFSV